MAIRLDDLSVFDKIYSTDECRVRDNGVMLAVNSRFVPKVAGSVAKYEIFMHNGVLSPVSPNLRI